MAPAPPEIYTLSLHDALPILRRLLERTGGKPEGLHTSEEVAATGLRELGRGPTYQFPFAGERERSEEHTSELQSPYDLVCRLLLEKKKKQKQTQQQHPRAGVA